eukprot:TRINITY_DN580_c0_g1::TRINITY_DN580_c0_g1_i1::g.10455::m.10455 TRINITY_DN580_c0_g1::TRINITY_DN580_c0_g1_i1::g.10455  ORF type:complete len:114 (+),score=8.55 TRINITY_DN580_c0_g1_i1:325-666(+)
MSCTSNRCKAVFKRETLTLPFFLFVDVENLLTRSDGGRSRPKNFKEVAIGENRLELIGVAHLKSEHWRCEIRYPSETAQQSIYLFDDLRGYEVPSSSKFASANTMMVLLYRRI